MDLVEMIMESEEFHVSPLQIFSFQKIQLLHCVQCNAFLTFSCCHSTANVLQGKFRLQSSGRSAASLPAGAYHRCRIFSETTIRNKTCCVAVMANTFAMKYSLQWFYGYSQTACIYSVQQISNWSISTLFTFQKEKKNVQCNYHLKLGHSEKLYF